jgi:hypothetical protein
MKEISWLVKDAAMPSNFFVELDPDVLKRILERRAGKPEETSCSERSEIARFL